jgi:hypothetical protein
MHFLIDYFPDFVLGLFNRAKNTLLKNDHGIRLFAVLYYLETLEND